MNTNLDIANTISVQERSLGSGVSGRIIFWTCIAWSVFQLYASSNIPYLLSQSLPGNWVFNSQETRQIHLAFAIFLASIIHPLTKRSTLSRVPWYDWILGLAGGACCLYLLFFRYDISQRPGLPITADLIVSATGLILLALAVFRTLGLPLLIVASVFVCYVFFGDSDWLPSVLQWKGASTSKALWHFWMQTEGVFGVALSVSASMIFLFVLFGALLERAGAGHYFIQLAFALLGHLRGGPAKAAVIASGFSGLYSGSSIANVVTTGTFTIPLMRKTGFTPEKAGAIEVASSTNGQLTPPVMGAAAFLIAEFTNISYFQLIQYAFLPAIISYIALFYIVHLEATKLGLQGMQRHGSARPWVRRILGFLTGFIAMALLAGLVYLLFGWTTALPGEIGFFSAIGVFIVLYFYLIRLAASRDDLEERLMSKNDVVLPKAADVAVTGLHFLLPVAVLLWCILVERISPPTSAFWASMAMVFVILTQHPLKRFFRGQPMSAAFSIGVNDLGEGMANGARNMVSIGVATGVAGIIIGTVALTGAHQVIGEFVEILSGGNLMLMLLLVAVMSLILGMGLPTTANYIVVSSLMAPVIVTVGAQSGLIVPLVAVHLFVFYFGILADDTPPVGLAAFAAAAISGGEPIRTGVQGFTYDMRTALLPFLFIFNTELLLMDVSVLEGVAVFVTATIAMLLFAAATQGFWLVRSRWYETLVLLLIAFTLFRPGYWLDQIQAPEIPLTGHAALSRDHINAEVVRVHIVGPDFDNPDKNHQTSVMIETGDTASGTASLADALRAQGLDFDLSAQTAELYEPMPGTTYFQSMSEFDFYADTPVQIANVYLPAQDRLPKQIFYIPAALLLIGVYLLQRRRKPETNSL